MKDRHLEPREYRYREHRKGAGKVMEYDAARALGLLRIGSGRADAIFRDGREDAVRYVVEGRGRLLVVRSPARTDAGKRWRSGMPVSRLGPGRAANKWAAIGQLKPFGSGTRQISAGQRPRLFIFVGIVRRSSFASPSFSTAFSAPYSLASRAFSR